MGRLRRPAGTGRDLKRANLERAVLLGVDLTSADLGGASFRAAEIDHASFGKARLQGAIFEKRPDAGLHVRCALCGHGPFRGKRTDAGADRRRLRRREDGAAAGAQGAGALAVRGLGERC